MKNKRVTQGFLRALATFLNKHPEFEKKTEDVMNRIVVGEKSGMNIHALHGPFKGYYSARISQKYRLVLFLESDAVTFIDIGSHDEVY